MNFAVVDDLFGTRAVGQSATTVGVGGALDLNLNYPTTARPKCHQVNIRCVAVFVQVADTETASFQFIRDDTLRGAAEIMQFIFF